jgi:hypothetical protein
MPDRALHFNQVVAGLDPLGGFQVFYGYYYVRKISHSGNV